MTGTPTLRAQYRAARILDLYDQRAERLDLMAERARATLTTAILALANPCGDGRAREAAIPGYLVQLMHDGTLRVEPTASPVPHEWTQTTMDEYLDA